MTLRLRTLLHVEDNDQDAGTLQHLLLDTPVRAHRVCSADEAIRYLQNSLVSRLSPVDLVLIDIRYFISNGTNVLSWVRQQPSFRRLPVIVLGHPVPSLEHQKVVQLGVDALWIKKDDLPGLKKLILRFAGCFEVPLPPPARLTAGSSGFRPGI